VGELVTQLPGNADLDAVRRILFGADVARLEQVLEEMKGQTAARTTEMEARATGGMQDLDRRVQQRLDELTQRVTAQLDDLSRRQQAHAEKVTQLLDQVMAELSRRTDQLQGETRSGLEEVKGKVADLEKRKLNASDFGGTLALLGQRFAAGDDAAK
jgi:DNA anti-recombination protein RmuC